MEISDCVDLIIGFYKDKVEKDSLENLSTKYKSLLLADANLRRTKKAECIKDMAKLKIELDRFEFIYSQVKAKCGECEAIENYMGSIRNEIKQLSNQKNRPS